MFGGMISLAERLSAVREGIWCFALTRQAHFPKPNVSKASIGRLER
jgi:hypothetical protein